MNKMTLTDMATFDIDNIETKPNTAEVKLYNGCTEECYQNHNEWYQRTICNHFFRSQGCPSNEIYRGGINNVAK